MNDPGHNPGQQFAGEATIVDLLRLFLRSNAILVLDGIEECEDSEDFLNCLLYLWKATSPFIVLLSRTNVAGLRRYVPLDNQLDLPKFAISEDIRVYSDNQLQYLFDEGILPKYAELQKSDMLKRMVSGADGMFLWARLMINVLRSPYMDTGQKLHMFSEINTPEGLGAMYQRIVQIIQQSPRSAAALASMVLTRLIYAPAPISSLQLRQSLVVDNILQPHLNPNTVKEFEEAVIMSCAGLVEPSRLHEDTSFLYDESALRTVHLSVNETLIQEHAISWVQGSVTQSQFVSDVIIGKLSCTTNCLKQLLFHTPAQPLAGILGQRISAEDLYSRLYFSDYAAANWLLYLQGFVNAIRTERFAFRKFSQKFLDTLLDFFSVLSVFLRNPKTMSVWLEAFYTARHMHIMYPPAEPLDELASWARHVTAVESQLSIDPSLISDIIGFGTELRDVVRTWGQLLYEQPHTVWDELPGFLSTNRYFWSSHSTQVSYQRPTVPSHCSPGQEPVASLSKTANSGEMKAILSIWANYCFYESGYKEKAWNAHGPFDLLELCSGWVATYELWKLQPEPNRLARIQVPIPPQEMIIPVKSYLYHRYSNEVSLPIAINQDVNAFAVLETLYLVTPSTDTERNSLRMYRLPFKDDRTTSFAWVVPTGNYKRPAMYSIYFSASADELALLEWQDCGTQYVTVCRYNHSQDLDIRVIRTRSFPPGTHKIERLLFHPYRDILAFCVFSMSARNSAILWAYREDLQQICQLVGQLFNAVEFSSCGIFLVTRNRFALPSQRPIIVQIAQNLLDLSERREHRPVQQESSFPSSSLTVAPSNALTTGLNGFGNSGLAELWKVDGVNGNVSSSIVSASTNGISLTNSFNSDYQVVKLVTLPTWERVNETTQHIFQPRFEGDSLKISVDVDTQSLSTHSSYQLSKAGGNMQPTFIQRDTRFISATNSTFNVLQGTPEARNQPLVYLPRADHPI